MFRGNVHIVYTRYIINWNTPNHIVYIYTIHYIHNTLYIFTHSTLEFINSVLSVCNFTSNGTSGISACIRYIYIYYIVHIYRCITYRYVYYICVHDNITPVYEYAAKVCLQYIYFHVYTKCIYFITLIYNTSNIKYK